MFTTRKKLALASTIAMSGFALMVAMGGTTAHAESKPALKEIVIVHGALVDGAKLAGRLRHPVQGWLPRDDSARAAHRSH